MQVLVVLCIYAGMDYFHCPGKQTSRRKQASIGSPRRGKWGSSEGLRLSDSVGLGWGVKFSDMAFGISNLLPCILSFFFLFFVSLACIVHRAYATRSASTWTPVYDVACEWGMQEDPRKGILRSDQLPQLDSNRCIVEKERMNERSKNASRDPTRKSVPRFFFGTSIQLASSKSPVHSAPGSPSRVPDHNPIDLPLGDGVVLHRNDSLSCNMSPSCIYACLTLSQRQCQYPAAILGSTETRGEQASEGTSRKHVEFRSECVCRLSASCPRPPAMLAA